jgi:hypothetical protein
VIAHAKRNVLLEGAEDYFQVWHVFWRLDRNGGFQDHAKAAEATFELFRDLLTLGLLEAGESSESGWSKTLPVTEALAQVQRECERLAAGDNDWSGPWFQATAEGETWVRRYYDSLALLFPDKRRPVGP